KREQTSAPVDSRTPQIMGEHRLLQDSQTVQAIARGSRTTIVRVNRTHLKIVAQHHALDSQTTIARVNRTRLKIVAQHHALASRTAIVRANRTPLTTATPPHAPARRLPIRRYHPHTHSPATRHT